MILCSSCNTECPDNANFCLNCGTPLKLKAQKKDQQELGITVSNDTITHTLKRLMPKSYVEKLLASKGKMEGERRVVTILFSDVKGSTSLAENLDPEEVLEVMNGAFNILIEPITRYEGTIARLMGDAILAFFGAPIAHEDDPYRACKAALEIISGAEKFSRKLEVGKGILDFGVRVGINTGLVVVAEVGTDLRVEYTAMGDAVNVAARMESAAEPGTILITEATKKFINNDFDLLSVGPIMVKGKSNPINTFRVVREKNGSNRSSIPTRFSSSFVGREQEIKKINDIINKLFSGKGSIVSITGDRGIGKSRLVAEVHNKKPSGLVWAEGRALSYNSNKSYWTAFNLIKNYFGFYQESFDQIMFDVIQNKVNKYFGDRSGEIYSYIECFINDCYDNKRKKETKYEELRVVKNQFYFAIKELIEKESFIHPIVLVLEDLQWADSSSLEFLTELLPLSKKRPVLFLLQYRLDENEQRAWGFREKIIKEHSDYHIEVMLHPLPENSLTSLTNHLTRQYNLSSEIKIQLIKKSEGNPSFLEELVNSLLDKLDSDFKNSSLEINEIDFQLPESLHSVVMSRVDCLEQTDKITLQTASVVGRVFSKKLLGRLLLDTLNDSEIDLSLKELQSRDFILRHLPSNISSTISTMEKEYIFKQDLAQNVIYNSLLLSQRQALHLRIGLEIEKIFSEDVTQQAESLAYHFEKGKDISKAILYTKIAADKAKYLFANDVAVSFYSHTLDLAKKTTADPTLIAQVYDSLGDVLFIRAEYSESVNCFNLALKYWDDNITQAKLYYKIGRVFERWGKYLDSLENYNNALKLLELEKERTLVCQIFSGIAMVFYRQGNLPEAENYITKAYQSLNTDDKIEEVADVYNYMGIIYTKIGQYDKAKDFYQKCIEIRDKLDTSSGLAAVYNNVGALYHQLNDLNGAIEFYNKSLEYCEKTGNIHGLAKTCDNLSHIYLTKGNNDLAMEYNLKAIGLLGKIAAGDSQMSEDVWIQSGVW